MENFTTPHNINEEHRKEYSKHAAFSYCKSFNQGHIYIDHI